MLMVNSQYFEYRFFKIYNYELTKGLMGTRNAHKSALLYADNLSDYGELSGCKIPVT